MKRFCILLLCLFAGSASAQGIDLGKAFSFGKKLVEATRDFSEEEEIEIGKGMAAGVLGAAPLVQDVEAQRYVNRIGRWLALQSERPDLPWRFSLIDSPDVNAFAMPGGQIMITRGLYERLRDESELAGVLAHEIGHVLKHHHIRAIKAAAGKELATMLGSEVAARSAKPHAGLANQLFGTGMQVMIKGLDKRDEYQADHIGVVLATRAGYNPFGLVGVLQTLDAISPKENGVSLLFSTHPAPASRIEKLSEKLGEQMDQYGETGKTLPRLQAIR